MTPKWNTINTTVMLQFFPINMEIGLTVMLLWRILNTVTCDPVITTSKHIGSEISTLSSPTFSLPPPGYVLH